MAIKYLKKQLKLHQLMILSTRDTVQKLLIELGKSKEEGCKQLTEKIR